MQELQEIKDYQQLEEYLAKIDYDELQNKINSENYAFYDFLEVKIQSDDLQAIIKRGFKLNLWEKFQMIF